MATNDTWKVTSPEGDTMRPVIKWPFQFVAFNELTVFHLCQMAAHRLEDETRCRAGLAYVSHA